MNFPATLHHKTLHTTGTYQNSKWDAHLLPTGCRSMCSHHASSRGPRAGVLPNLGSIISVTKIMVGHAVASARDSSLPDRNGPSGLAISSK